MQLKLLLWCMKRLLFSFSIKNLSAGTTSELSQFEGCLGNNYAQLKSHGFLSIWHIFEEKPKVGVKIVYVTFTT